MVEIVDLPAHPFTFILTAFSVGFAAATLAKFYGLFFTQRKPSFRIGAAVSADRIEVIEWNKGKGYVAAGGELWRATSKDALSRGDVVRVAAVDGLMLKVNRKQALRRL